MALTWGAELGDGDDRVHLQHHGGQARQAVAAVTVSTSTDTADSGAGAQKPSRGTGGPEYNTLG